MNSKSIMLALGFLLTISSLAQAYLVPGQPGQPGQTDSGKPSYDPNRPGQYNPGPGQGQGPRPPGYGGGGGGSYYPPPRPNYPPPPPPHHGGGNYYPPPPRPNYPPPPPSQPPYYPPSQPDYGQRYVQQIYVGRSVANEFFPLSQYAQLNSQFYGWEITAVRATTRPNSPYRTVAQLVTSDRNVLASEVNPGYQIDLYPNCSVIAGYQELYLSIEGSTFIDTIEVELFRR